MTSQDSRTDGHSRPGRPRDPGADDAILDAAVELLGTLGMAGLTVDALIAHAGVTRTMLYRRWRSKEEVLHAAVLRAFDAAVPTPDTGDVRADLVEELRALIAMLTDTPLGRAFPMLMAEAAHDAEWARTWDSIATARRRQARVILERAIARGQLQDGIDPDLVLDLLSGAVYARILVRRVAAHPDDAKSIVDALLPSFVDSPERTPGRQAPQ